MQLILAWLALAVGWLRGGRTERRAVVVLFCDHAVTAAAEGMARGDLVVAISRFVMALIFGWMALASDRWWPFAAAGALALGVVLADLDWVDPDLSRYAVLSAQIGLWISVYVSLLAGVVERRLAGEPAVSDTAAWRRRRAPTS